MNSYIPIGLFGISHKKAPVAVREQVALSDTEQQQVLEQLVDKFPIDGCLIISTCNRSEIYVSGEGYEEYIKDMRKWLDDFKGTTHYADDTVAFEYYGIDAVGHFYEVFSGLDSQIIGEPQIISQVKSGYKLAHELKVSGTALNKLFNYGLQTEKKVRSETYLAEGAVSVSYAGVELARKVFNTLEGKKALLIGAGETAELAATHFAEKGISEIHIANRTYEKAVLLAAKFDGTAHALADLEAVLAQVDIVISATSSTEYVLTADMMKKVCRQRHYEPVFLIDLAIPRDFDPAINKIDGAFMYNLDDLNEIIAHNLEKRRQEIPKAMKIVEKYQDEFRNWVATHAMASAIGRLRAYFDTIRTGELQRLHNRLPQANIQDIEYLTQSIINKVMHQHIVTLKKNAGNAEAYQKHLEFVYNLYGIEDE